ncbi:ATP-binding protein [Candidatus Woesearchaeota archaeon]|nr:ATP-binding protein [Candidatus Woesearchaeota archaeon]
MYLKREISRKFEKVNRSYPIVAIVGPRQAGKTTFLREYAKTADASYLLFDDPDVRAMFDEDVKKFESQYLEGHSVGILDEVQYGRDPGRKLKYLADKGRKLWITSSSEMLLGKEVLSYLVGRVSVLHLFPFSLAEAFSLKGQREVTPDIIRRVVAEHIQFGGYPKAMLEQDHELKKTMLRDLYTTMVLKDIAQTFSLGDINALERCSVYLSHNAGSLISYESMASSLHLSFHTLKKYLDAMEKSCLISLISPFFENKAKEIAKQPKVYFWDTGLRNAIANAFPESPDGRLFENYVCAELLKMGCRVRHWRTKAKAEVDFVVEKDNGVIPIEAKVSMPSLKVERSLHAFIKRYNPPFALVVSYDGLQGRKKAGSCVVHFTDVLGMRGLVGGKIE